jgi:hypothetical protein
MKPIALLITLLMLLAAPAARAQPLVLTLVPSPEEVADAHRQMVTGRSIFVAGVVTQGAGLGLSLVTVFGGFGNGGGLIGGASSALILGTTSLVLIPVGAVLWAKGARRERLLREGALTF